MSMILDALKRSESDRQAGEAEDPRDAETSPPADDDHDEPRSSKRLWIGVGLFCVIVLGGAAAYKFLQPAGPPAEVVRQPNPELTRAAPAPAVDEDTKKSPQPTDRPDTAATGTSTQTEPAAAEQATSAASGVPAKPAGDDAPAPIAEAAAAPPSARPAPAPPSVKTVPAIDDPPAKPVTSTAQDISAPAHTAPSKPARAPQVAEPRTLIPIAPLPPAPAPLPTPATVTKGPNPKPALAGVTPPRKSTAQPQADPSAAAYADAVRFEKTGDTSKAITAYTEALRLNPDFADAYMGRGWARIAAGAHTGAVRDFDAFLALEPDTAEAHFARAWAYEKRGDRRAAITDYGLAISFAPGYGDAHMSRGVLAFYNGDFDGAGGDFNIVRDSADPTLGDFALIWGYIAEARAGANSEALNAAHAGIGNRTEWPGLIYAVLRGRADDADVLDWIRNTDQAKRREMECVAFFFLGQARLLKGDTDGARSYFEKALATGATAYRQFEAARIELARMGN